MLRQATGKLVQPLRPVAARSVSSLAVAARPPWESRSARRSVRSASRRRGLGNVASMKNIDADREAIVRLLYSIASKSEVERYLRMCGGYRGDPR